jgi:hypothetical protein
MLLEAHRKPDGKVDPEDEYDIKGSAGTLYAGESINHWRVRADYHLTTLAAAETVIATVFPAMLINRFLDCCCARDIHACHDSAA